MFFRAAVIEIAGLDGLDAGGAGASESEVDETAAPPPARPSFNPLDASFHNPICALRGTSRLCMSIDRRMEAYMVLPGSLFSLVCFLPLLLQLLFQYGGSGVRLGLTRTQVRRDGKGVQQTMCDQGYITSQKITI